MKEEIRFFTVDVFLFFISCVRFRHYSYNHNENVEGLSQQPLKGILNAFDDL